ncbi:DUF3558 family protein [Saccharopolyspora sp. NPDC002578]
MSKLVRSLAVVASSAVLVGLSGCALGEGDGTQAPTSDAAGASLEAFDPCTFFSPDDLTGFGLSPQSEPFTQVSFEPGCRWTGEKMSLTLHKNVDETVDSYETGGNWEKYEKRSIAGRSAAIANVPGSGTTGGCDILVDAGGGVAIYGISGKMADSIDACPELEKIVNQTASGLPK